MNGISPRIKLRIRRMKVMAKLIMINSIMFTISMLLFLYSISAAMTFVSGSVVCVTLAAQYIFTSCLIIDAKIVDPNKNK